MRRRPGLTRRDLLNIYGSTLLGSLVIGFFGFGVPWWVAGPAFGFSIATGVVAIISVMPLLRRPSFVATILLQVVVIGVIMSGAFALALALCVAYGSQNWLWAAKTWELVGDILVRRGVLRFMLMSIGVTFVFSAIHQVSRKLGPGVLRNWLTGRYHEPREEERIFMFLDIKDSTTLAERLGNLPFSRMVRDFFEDMALPCDKTKAEVSHYIGDEAVISWKIANGARQANCVRFFFLMQERIRQQAAHYEREFGLVPEFKAGIHVGPVVATEVGEAKSEIVFHGDVMNTTARIQGLCNSLGFDLLISEELRSRLGDELHCFELTPLGTHTVKGRVAPVTLHAVVKRR